MDVDWKERMKNQDIQELIEIEIWDLGGIKDKLKDLENKWFKLGKKNLVKFLKNYIKRKEEFIKTLEIEKQRCI